MKGDAIRYGLRGLIAGAAGTIALDMTTYGDMLVRGRPASNVPATLAGKLADVAGIDMLGSRRTDQYAGSRREAAGSLMGYGTGLVIGGLYGLAQGDRAGTRNLLMGTVVGLLAMAASDLPIALTGVSNPREWSLVDWASDLVPHVIYGMVVVETYEAIGRSTVRST